MRLEDDYEAAESVNKCDAVEGVLRSVVGNVLCSCKATAWWIMTNMTKIRLELLYYQENTSD